MASTDFKLLLLQRYASELFTLAETLQSLTYSPDHHPIIRYDRGIYSDFEFYWCSSDIPTAPLEIVWASHSNSPTLTPAGTSNSIPAEVQQRALALLQELDSQRELVALYRCGYMEDDVFVLSSWLIPFPAGYDKDKGDGSGVYYTVSRTGVLGLAEKYIGNKELYAALI